MATSTLASSAFCKALCKRAGWASTITGVSASRRSPQLQAVAYDDIRRTLEAAPPGDSRDRRLAITYHSLGMVAQDRGDLAAAEDGYRKSLEIKKKLGNRPGMANSYGQLGMVAQDRGDLAAAKNWYTKALAI